MKAFGTYREDLARRFLGLEAYPVYRAGGRLENYLGDPPLSSGAAVVVQSLAVRSIDNLAAFGSAHPNFLADLEGLGKTMVALLGLTLEELASASFLSIVRQHLERSDGRASAATSE